MDRALVDRIEADWRLAAPPIRPSRQRLDTFRSALGPARTGLVLGATPELIDMLVAAPMDRVAALDAHAETIAAMRRFAAEDWARVELVVGDWREPRSAWAGAFDLVLCTGGLMFVPFPEGWRAVFAAVHGYLRPGGRLVSSQFSLAPTETSFRDRYETAVGAFERERAALDAAQADRRFVELVSSLKGATLFGAVDAGGNVDLDRVAAAAAWIAADLRGRYPAAPSRRVVEAIFGRSNPVGIDGANLTAVPSHERVEAELVGGGFAVEVLSSDHRPPLHMFTLACTRRR